MPDSPADPRDHPAAAAWRRSGAGREPPAAISVVQESRRSAVYVLHGAGPAGRGIVAKRSPLPKVLVEKTIYEEVLPRLPGASVACLGFAPGEEDETGWIFVEEVRGRPYASDSRADREMAARWLAMLHLGAAPLRLRGRLPGRSPPERLDQLAETRERIESGISNPLLSAADREVLRGVARDLEALASGWDRLALLCRDAPCTVMHGDFARKNMLVHGEGAEAELRVFDWGTAGWGVPAADLAQNEPGETYWPSPDLDTYRRLARVRWPQLDRDALRTLAAVGKIVRTLAAMHGDAITLSTPWPGEAMRKFPVYALHLAAGLTHAGFLPARPAGSRSMAGGW